MVAGGVHGAANTRLPDGARRTLEIDEASRGRKIRSRGSFLALGLEMRRGTLAPTTQASQAVIPQRCHATNATEPSNAAVHFPGPLREAQGDASKRSEISQGRPVQGSGERITYPADVYPPRRAGEATALAGRKNSAMTGAAYHLQLPEVRRSGDVGGAANQNQKETTRNLSHAIPTTRRCSETVGAVREPPLPTKPPNGNGARIPRLNAPKQSSPNNPTHPVHPCEFNPAPELSSD